MSKFWSKKVQSTDLLYYSRLEKFNEENIEEWFSFLKIKDGMRILEVGCGAGNLLNMIKSHFKNCEVHGIDLDENHIRFAKENSLKLGIDIDYRVADIKSLPYDSDYFDIVYSHTVVEHLPFDDFIKEQTRVLKPNGRIVIMRVAVENKKHDNPFLNYEEDVNNAYLKLKYQQDGYKAQYYAPPETNMKQLEKYGYKNIDLKFNRFLYYFPDIQPKDIALEQIKRNYLTKLTNAEFYLSISSNGEEVGDELLGLLEKQYLERLKIYNSNEKLFDYQSTDVIFISANK